MPYELSLVVLRLIAVLEVSWLLPACQTFNFERLSLACSYSKVYQSYFQLLPTKFPEDFFSILFSSSSFSLSLFLSLFFLLFFQIQIRHIFAWHLRLIKLASASIHCLKLFRKVFSLLSKRIEEVFHHLQSLGYFFFSKVCAVPLVHWRDVFPFFDVNMIPRFLFTCIYIYFFIRFYLFIYFFKNDWAYWKTSQLSGVI